MFGVAGRSTGTADSIACLCTVDLLADGGTGEHCRYPDHRCTDRWAIGELVCQHIGVRGLPRHRFPRVVPRGGHAVDPLDQHTFAGIFLLGGHPRYVCARHGSRGFGYRGIGTRICPGDCGVRRTDRVDFVRLFPWRWLSVDVLDCLHFNAATWRFARGSALAVEDVWRTWLGQRWDEHCISFGYRCACDLREHYPA